MGVLGCFNIYGGSFVGDVLTVWVDRGLGVGHHGRHLLKGFTRKGLR